MTDLPRPYDARLPNPGDRHFDWQDATQGIAGIDGIDPAPEELRDACERPDPDAPDTTHFPAGASYEAEVPDPGFPTGDDPDREELNAPPTADPGLTFGLPASVGEVVLGREPDKQGEIGQAEAGEQVPQPAPEPPAEQVDLPITAGADQSSEGEGKTEQPPNYRYELSGSGAHRAQQERGELNRLLHEARSVRFAGQVDPTKSQKEDIEAITQGIHEAARRAGCDVTPPRLEEYHLFDDETSFATAAERWGAPTRGANNFYHGIIWRNTGNGGADLEGLAHEAAHDASLRRVVVELDTTGKVNEKGEPDINAVDARIDTFALAQQYMGNEANGQTGRALVELTTNVYADESLQRAGRYGLLYSTYPQLDIIGDELIHGVAGMLDQPPYQFEYALTRLRLNGDPTAFNQIAEYLGPDRMRIFLQAPTNMDNEQAKDLARALGVDGAAHRIDQYYAFTGRIFSWRRER